MIEVGTGAQRILTYKTHDTIENNATRIVFISYEQDSKIQVLIEKYHWQKLSITEFNENVVDNKKIKVLIEKKKE